MKIYLSKPGIISSAGKNPQELFKTLQEGDNSSIKKRKVSEEHDFYVAGVNKDDFEAVNSPDCTYDSKLIRMENAALNQLEESVKKAIEKYGASRIGVCVGSCDNLTELSGPAHLKYFEKGDFSGYSIEKQSAQYVARFAKEKFKLEGLSSAFSTACSSSAVAIIKAAQLIKAGLCDAVIAGGADIASDTALLGFGSLEAISPEKTNPFSKNRHGINLGEAAAFFLLCKEDLDDTGIILAGYGESADAYHMTSPDPEGSGAAKAMDEALAKAGLKACDIGYVNLHGTGTKFNDSMEAKAVDKVFASYKVPCSTTKGSTGHTLGAAAALELAVCFELLKASASEESCLLPAQNWDGIQDESMPVLNIVKKGSTSPAKISACMSNSFAFGGANASLIIVKE